MDHWGCGEQLKEPRERKKVTARQKGLQPDSMAPSTQMWGTCLETLYRGYGGPMVWYLGYLVGQLGGCW